MNLYNEIAFLDIFTEANNYTILLFCLKSPQLKKKCFLKNTKVNEIKKMFNQTNIIFPHSIFCKEFINIKQKYQQEFPQPYPRRANEINFERF